MKKYIKFFHLYSLIFFLFISGCAVQDATLNQFFEPEKPVVSISPSFYPDVYTVVAIHIIPNSRVRNADGVISVIESFFMQELTSKGYNVTLLHKNSKYKRSSDNNESSLLEIASNQQIKGLVIVDINDITVNRKQSYYESSISISSRLIRAETGTIMWSSILTTGFYESDRNTPFNSIEKVARAVARSFPDK